jgi:hypothetical protein
MECVVMGQRFHRGFTAAEKTELWDRWKRGESLKAIGRAFGKQSSSIYFLVAPRASALRLLGFDSDQGAFTVLRFDARGCVGEDHGTNNHRILGRAIRGSRK